MPSDLTLHIPTPDRSAFVWFGWLGLFLVLEMLGYWHVTPWTTLSEFAWHLEDVEPWLRYLFLFGLALLLVHIVARWPR